MRQDGGNETKIIAVSGRFHEEPNAIFRGYLCDVSHSWDISCNADFRLRPFPDIANNS
jgi:hypothetical protein